MYVQNIHIMITYIYLYMYIYKERKMGKKLVNTKHFPTSFSRGRSQGVCCLYDF